MNFIEEMANKALNDSYLKRLIHKSEKVYGEAVFRNEDGENLTEKEYRDSLRFADILSRSGDENARNLSLKIISLLHENCKYKNEDYFKLFSTSVLTKLGNFPSLEVSENNLEFDEEEIQREKIIKEVMQQAPESDKIFTDSQYKIFEKLKNSNHYSFSGSTSFGKSFVFEAFMKYIISERNASDNIAILVPTRALINQVSLKLKTEIKNKNYKIISHPKVPLLYKSEEMKYIFVFTAERLISYFSDSDNPTINYLFVDEAHKLLNDDSRTPLLYHALTQAKRKSVKMYFASPNIPNVEVFLQLFNNSTEESTAITESPVTQNRFFIDCLNEKSIMFSDFGKSITLKGLQFSRKIDEQEREIENLREVLLRLGESNQNIVYCNTINYTINHARYFSESLEDIENSEISDLITDIRSSIHEQYFLIDCLKKGVAFHFGGMPQQIRERVERLFKEGHIKYLFCTSTLLEGVNLPAKNIFIISSKIGIRKMNSIDFWNLAGRAGRLAQDLSGNIFCCHIIDKDGYWKNSRDIEVLQTKKIESLKPAIMRENDQNLYKNIQNFLAQKPYTTEKLRTGKDFEKRKSIENYGNILTYHNSLKSDSLLRNVFLEKNPDGRETLKEIDSKIKIPEEILAQSTTIRVDVQNEIFNSDDLQELPSQTDYKSCLKLLEILYDRYHWKDDESGGKKPLVNKDSTTKLEYYAVLMHHWVNSKPLNYIIKQTIEYYDNKGISRNFQLSQNEYVRFEKNNPNHINILINNLMSDIENTIRFKIKSYVNNYVLLMSAKEMTPKNNWSDYLEYGTTNSLILEIQNFGFPRHIATFLKNNHEDCFKYDYNGEVIEFNDKKIKNEIDASKYRMEFVELSEILEW